VTKLELGLGEAQHKLTSHELLAAQAAEARQLLVSTRKQRGEAVQHTVAEAEGSRQQTLRRLVTLEQERALSEARARMAAEASAAAERAQLASTAAQGEARRLQAAAQQAAQAAQAAAMQASSGAAGGSLGLIDGGGPSALPAANGFSLEGCGVGASGEPVLLCTLHPMHLLCTLSAPSLHRLCAPLHRLGPFAPPPLCTASVRPLHPPRYRPATAPLPPRYRPSTAPHLPPPLCRAVRTSLARSTWWRAALAARHAQQRDSWDSWSLAVGWVARWVLGWAAAAARARAFSHFCFAWDSRGCFPPSCRTT
jgi:hypothetical protein